jgi:hypothetical protein
VVRCVSDTVTKRDVDCVALSALDTGVLHGVSHALAGRPIKTHANVASTREELSETVEGTGHDTVGGVKGLLDAISVVDIDVNVKNTRVNAKKLENTEDTAKVD